jgi:dienelactone hydrolase
MGIRRETIVYEGPGGPFEGVAAWDDATDDRRPGVLVIPNILGQKESDNVVAERLAELGYVALACDVFGQGKRTERNTPETSKYMDELNADRPLLRGRLEASLAALKALPVVDGDRCAAIGFCFGGKAALDIARFGGDVLAVVSFHGVYDRPDYDSVSPIAAKMLVCHGWNDPLGPPDAVTALGEELTDANADWQIHAYGGAGHAFTDREMEDTGSGFGFNADADRRSWQAMKDLFADVFG